MKYIFVLLSVVLTLNHTILLGQAKTNLGVIQFQQEYKSQLKKHQLNQSFIQDFDLIRLDNLFLVGILALVDSSQISESELSHLNIKCDTRLSDLWSFRVPIQHVNQFLLLSGIRYAEIAEPVSPDLEHAQKSTRVDSVHAGLGGLSLPYKGTGVVIAVIDWGFDYTNPNFYDTTYQKYRIVSAWDQNKTSGPAPSGYSFGTEYNGKSQLLAAGCDTNYVFGYGSHGTHVAGIAAGSGSGTPHIGAAPDADLIFISLRRDAPSFIDALSYISNYAASVDKPFVVNMSFGSHLGPHDGSMLKNYAMDIIQGPGKIFVGSAGNNGTTSANFHLDRDFTISSLDTLKTVVNFDNQVDGFGQTLSMWGSENSSFKAAIRLVNNANVTQYETPFFNSELQPFQTDTVLVGSDTLIIRVQALAQHFLNDKPNIRFEIKRTGSLKVVLMVTSDNSHVHIWNNVRMNNRYTNWGTPLTASYPSASSGNNDFGLGEPAGVGKSVITVGSYRAEQFLSSGNQIYGQVSNFSSKGPTVDGRRKPDISSTGGNVMSSINSFDITETPSSTSVDFEGKTYYFKSYSGTSMSGPMVSGIVALMLEAYPNLSAIDAKAILKLTARLDQFTGQIDPGLGDLQWGWGKANALAAVKAVEMFASLPTIQLQENLILLFPNPAVSELNIQLTNNEIIQAIEVFDLNGKTIFTQSNFMGNTAKIDVRDLISGTYLVKVSTQNLFTIKKFVKN